MYNSSIKSFPALVGVALMTLLLSASVLAQPSFVVEDTTGPIGDVTQVRWHFQDTDPGTICGIDVCVFVPDNEITNINLDNCFDDVGAPHAGSTFSECAVRTDGSCFTDSVVPTVPADTSVIRIALIDFGSTIQNPGITEDAAGFLNLTLSGALNDQDTITIEAHQVAGAFAECDGTPVTPDVVADGTITALAATAVLNVQPDTLNFGTQQTGSTSAPQSVTVSNDGTDGLNLEITGINVTGEFDNAGGSCTVGTILADSETCTIDATFSPATDGVKAGTIVVTSDAGDVTNDTVNLNGEGIPTDAELTIDPASFDFGPLDINDPAECTTFTLANTPGTDSLTIGTASVPAPFTVTGNCDGVTLGGGDSCDVDVCFDPDSEAVFSETLSVTSDVNDVTATVDGEGTTEADVTVNPPFGPVDLGVGAPGELISANGSADNSGSADAELSCTLTGDTTVISTDPDPLAGTVPAGGSLPFTLNCALPEDGVEGDEYNATLSCDLDGEPAGTHDISCGISTFEPLPVPTMQAWAMALFALLMLLAGGISIRYFRTN